MRKTTIQNQNNTDWNNVLWTNETKPYVPSSLCPDANIKYAKRGLWRAWRRLSYVLELSGAKCSAQWQKTWSQSWVLQSDGIFWQVLAE